MNHRMRLVDGHDHQITDAEFRRLRANDRDPAGRAYPGRLAVCKHCDAVVRWIETEAGKQAPVAPFPLAGNWDRPIYGYGPERTDGRPPESYGVLYVFPQSDALARDSGWKAGTAGGWRAKLFMKPPPTVRGFRPHHADCPRSAAPEATGPGTVPPAVVH